MNSEAFYKEIGNIDDDLIQAASEAHGKKRRKPLFYGIAGIAACLCLIFGVIFLVPKRDVIYINEISSPMTNAKLIVPSAEGTKTIVMTYRELMSYYGIDRLPDDLENGLAMAKQSYFVIYRDQSGNVIADTNILYYNNFDGSKGLSVTIAKADKFPEIPGGNIKRSRLSGVSVILASENNADYWASVSLNGISINITSRGLSEDDFINTVGGIIDSIK